eukprot:scaffold564_cov172-Ochromonas_danica.AAC.8
MNNNRVIIIRKFEESDQEEVAFLYRHAFQCYQGDIPEIAFCTNWFIEDKLKEGGDMASVYQSYITNSDPKKCFWVAVDVTQASSNDNDNTAGKGVIVGCVGCLPSTEFDPTQYLELVRMTVHPQYQGYDIGKRLLAALFEWGKQWGFQFINLTTLDGMKPAVRFYQKNGFQLHHQEKLNLEEEKLFQQKFESGNQVHVVHFVKEI